MTDPDSEDHQAQDHQAQPRRPVLHGRRTRVLVAIVGCAFSLGAPIAALSAPTLAVDQQTVRVPDDPAGLGSTGAPGREEEPGDAAPEIGLPGGSAELPGIPTPPDLPDGPLGIPGAVLDAYQFAERTLAEIRPGCHLPWSVLAGIGRIESNHASDGRVDAFGNTLGPILGPQLDGSPGIAAIADTDQGVLDGDTVWDRAVGPMQFIPSTWRSVGVDGNGDGVVNPNNVYDSTVATGLYLCAADTDLSDPAQLQAAVFRYNHSATYVDVVLRWAHAYLTGVISTPSAPGPVPPGTNGNGGRLVVPEGTAPAAPPLSAVVQAVPVAPPTSISSVAPTTASPPPPSSPVAAPTPTPTTPPATSSTPSPSPIPAATTTTSPATPSPPTESPAPTPSPMVTTTPLPPTPTPSPSPPGGL